MLVLLLQLQLPLLLLLLLSASSQHVARVSGFVACWHAAAAATELLGMQFAIVALAQFKWPPILVRLHTHTNTRAYITQLRSRKSEDQRRKWEDVLQVARKTGKSTRYEQRKGATPRFPRQPFNHSYYTRQHCFNSQEYNLSSAYYFIRRIMKFHKAIGYNDLNCVQ